MFVSLSLLCPGTRIFPHASFGNCRTRVPFFFGTGSGQQMILTGGYPVQSSRQKVLHWKGPTPPKRPPGSGLGPEQGGGGVRSFRRTLVITIRSFLRTPWSLSVALWATGFGPLFGLEKTQKLANLHLRGRFEEHMGTGSKFMKSLDNIHIYIYISSHGLPGQKYGQTDLLVTDLPDNNPGSSPKPFISPSCHV
jgi:hypothetical protein